MQSSGDAVCLQVTDIPLQDLPQDVKHILESYAAHLDIQVVSQFVQRLVEAVLETVPEGNSKQAVPKAKVTYCSIVSSWPLYWSSTKFSLYQIVLNQRYHCSQNAVTGSHCLVLTWRLSQNQASYKEKSSRLHEQQVCVVFWSDTVEDRNPQEADPMCDGSTLPQQWPPSLEHDK